MKTRISLKNYVHLPEPWGSKFPNVLIYKIDLDELEGYSPRVIADILRRDAYEHFQRTVEAAALAGLLDDFIIQIERLNAGQDGELAILDWDWAPFSFNFVIGKAVEVDGDLFLQPYYNGGLILHGFHDGWGSGGSPTFTVSLEGRKSKPYWGLHT